MERVLDLEYTFNGRGVSPSRTAVQGAFSTHLLSPMFASASLVTVGAM
jgi:hypothetical protein